MYLVLLGCVYVIQPYHSLVFVFAEVSIKLNFPISTTSVGLSHFSSAPTWRIVEHDVCRRFRCSSIGFLLSDLMSYEKQVLRFYSLVDVSYTTNAKSSSIKVGRGQIREHTY